MKKIKQKGKSFIFLEAVFFVYFSLKVVKDYYL